jgi:hypothetical protein
MYPASQFVSDAPGVSEKKSVTPLASMSLSAASGKVECPLFRSCFPMTWHPAVELQQQWVWYASGIVLGVAIQAERSEPPA